MGRVRGHAENPSWVRWEWGGRGSVRSAGYPVSTALGRASPGCPTPAPPPLLISRSPVPSYSAHSQTRLRLVSAWLVAGPTHFQKYRVLSCLKATSIQGSPARRGRGRWAGGGGGGAQRPRVLAPLAL